MFTLLGIITVGLLTTGKNKNRFWNGEIPKTPPHYPGRNFTSAKRFNFKMQNFRHSVFRLLGFQVGIYQFWSLFIAIIWNKSWTIDHYDKIWGK